MSETQKCYDNCGEFGHKVHTPLCSAMRKAEYPEASPTPPKIILTNPTMISHGDACHFKGEPCGECEREASPTAATPSDPLCIECSRPFSEHSKGREHWCPQQYTKLKYKYRPMAFIAAQPIEAAPTSDAISAEHARKMEAIPKEHMEFVEKIVTDWINAINVELAKLRADWNAALKRAEKAESALATLQQRWDLVWDAPSEGQHPIASSILVARTIL